MRAMTLPSRPLPPTAAPAEQSAEFGNDFRGKGRIVDVLRQPYEAPRTGLANRAF